MTNTTPTPHPSGPDEPIAHVANDYNASGLSCHITEYLPAGMALYARPSAMPALTDAMRAVLRNERDVYGNEDALYAALAAAAALQAQGSAQGSALGSMTSPHTSPGGPGQPVPMPASETVQEKAAPSDRKIPDAVSHYGLIDERVGAPPATRPAPSAEPAAPDWSAINVIIARHFPDDPANACRAHAAIAEVLRAQPAASAEYSRFLTDVMTAAGLVSHGKQCKALGERLGAGAMKYRFQAPVASVEPVAAVVREHDGRAFAVLRPEGENLPDGTELYAAPIAAQAQPSGNAGELPDVLADALSNLEHDNYERSYSGSKNREADAALIRAALAAQASGQDDSCLRERITELLDTNRRQQVQIKTLEARIHRQAQDAVAELVHAMFRSGNEIPIERITITRQQYDAARAAGGEQ